METILLAGKKELDIYINPQRQQLLRTLTLHGQPMTPKQISVYMGISASAVQHHIRKLVELGVVEQTHTESIRGIMAHYYRAKAVMVRIGCEAGDAAQPQRMALIQNGVNSVLNGYLQYVANATPTVAAPDALGDVLWGVARLLPQDAAKLMSLIRDFVAKQDATLATGDVWEYALIAYPVAEDAHA